MPFVRISPTSSGGVCSNTSFILSTISITLSCRKSYISLSLISTLSGRPFIRCLPFTVIFTSPVGLYTLAISFFACSAVFSPISILYFIVTPRIIAASNLLPAILSEQLFTIPLNETTAISAVPPPTSTTIVPLGFEISIPAPSSAAIGSSIMNTFLAPAQSAASTTALFSTSVTDEGTQRIILGFTIRPITFLINSIIIASVISLSEITPSLSGLTATIYSGVLPIILYASFPTARTQCFFLS